MNAKPRLSKSRPSADESPAKERRSGLRSGKLSWAEMCDAADGGLDVNSPFKALAVNTPDKQGKADKGTKSQEVKASNGATANGKAAKSPKSQEVKEKVSHVGGSPPRTRGSTKKRERQDGALLTSPSLEGVKRRLGWSRARNVPDDVSTEESSSMCSSEDLEGGARYEADPEVLRRRQKQIDYGKNTRGYRLYVAAVPKASRTAEHIFTPKKHVKYSRRSWDAQIKAWRKRLHDWDPRSEDEEEDQQADVDLSDMAGLVG
ncbi:hypothetical protein JTE90_014983 [Oedothorax gibbosus]|uniref:Histone RNA hairpin-binding protein RNA-binding domain-containing protein n=1 Tax=Oedothorax gibbosus TaxID=931172 RepID=A0AAV6UX91_9ARAC|nr:hypothetical protein JTE90_014983 [Oedothorax gibbosus]